MKKLLISALVMAVAIAQAAQKTTFTQKEVRDPRQLAVILAANATDAETRLATIGTNENAVVTGTLGVTGVATFTAESVHNGGLDADYVTVDAAAGIDTKTAGALVVGAATATSVSVGASDAGVTIPGTLAVTGVATLTAAPKLTATTATGAIALTLTNGPTACDAGKAAPIYLTVSSGTNSYVVAAWPLTP